MNTVLRDLLGKGRGMAHLAQGRRIDQADAPINERLKRRFRPRRGILPQQPHVVQ